MQRFYAGRHSHGPATFLSVQYNIIFDSLPLSVRNLHNFLMLIIGLRS